MADETGAVATATGAAGSSPAPNTASVASESSAAPATGAPAQSGAHDPAGTGEPPKERWSEILANARTKTRGEVEAEYRQKYGWADQFKTNPYEFVEGWMDQLAQHPQYSPQLLAKAARLLQSRRGAAKDVGEKPTPDVPIMDANGTITGYTYSDKQHDALDEWRWAQREAKLTERFGPLEQMKTALEQQAEHAELQAQSQEHAQTTLTTLRQNPYFKEHEAKVKAALASHEEWGDNVPAAFNHVLPTEILPGLSQTEQRKVVESLQQKASAGTVSPSGAAPPATPKFKSFAEAQRYYSEHPAEAEAMANR